MNAAAHQWTAGAAIGLFMANREKQEGEATLAPAAGAVLGAVLTKLPDLLEPATSPQHRQFFHSLAFAAALGYGLCKLHDWEPEDELGKLARWVGLVGGSAYLVHLALDFTTAKSLPLVGKL